MFLCSHTIIRERINSCLLKLVVVTPSSLSRILVILCQDFLGNFGVHGWFAIAFPFYLLILVRSLFLVFTKVTVVKIVH